MSLLEEIQQCLKKKEEEKTPKLTVILNDVKITQPLSMEELKELKVTLDALGRNYKLKATPIKETETYKVFLNERRLNSDATTKKEITKELIDVLNNPALLTRDRVLVVLDYQDKSLDITFN